MTPVAAPAVGSTADITIVHLAVDYNTPHRPRTTTAVEWFVSELTGIENVVIAMLRTSGLSRRPPVECHAAKGRLFDFPFFGLPLGIGLHRAIVTFTFRVGLRAL